MPYTIYDLIDKLQCSIDKKSSFIRINKYICEMNSHSAIISFLILIYYVLIFIFAVSIESLYHWGILILTFIGSFYFIIMIIYINKIIKSWDISIKTGLLKFSNLCIHLSMKNYRLLREYREIYQYHCKELFNKCHENIHDIKYDMKNNKDVQAYVDYVLQSDTTDKMESNESIRANINKINQYISLCYYLSFISSCDELEMRQNNIYINIKTESIMNKRNRKLESIINCIPYNYKVELLHAWTNTDKTQSEKILTIIPCKWIMYEYRNIFRYLHCTKYFKNIYSSFEKDYTEIENIVFDICSTLQYIFRKETMNVNYLPKSFINLFNMLSNMFIFIVDNYIAINIIYCSMIFGSFIISVIFSFICHVIVICLINNIIDVIRESRDPLKKCSDIDNIDNKIEAIFSEMKVILTDCKNNKN